MAGPFDDIIDGIQGTAPQSTLSTNQNDNVFGPELDAIAPQQVDPARVEYVGKPMTGNQGLWGPLAEWSDAALLGQGSRRIAPAQKALSEGVREFGAGVPMNRLWGNMADTYGQAQDIYGRAKTDWERQHSTNALAANTLGSLPTTLGAMALGQEYVAAPAAEGLMAVAPKAGPAIANFLAGESGGMSSLGSAMKWLASKGTSGAIQGAEAGVLQTDLTGGSTGQNAKTGAMVGAIANPVVGVLSPSINRLLNADVSPEAARSADVLASDAGVQVLPHQVARGLASTARDLGVRGNVGQLEDLTQGVLEKIDPMTTERTVQPEFIGKAYQQLGTRFSQVAQNINNVADQPLVQQLGNIGKDMAMELPSDDPRRKLVEHFLNNLDGDITNGALDGTKFRSYTRYNEPLGRQLLQSNDPTLKHYGQQIVSALYDALGRNAAPGDVAELSTLRNRWKNLVASEDLLRSAVKDGAGLVNPGQLAKVVNGGPDLQKLSGASSLLKDTKPTPQGGVSEPQYVGNNRLIGTLKSVVFGGAGGASAAMGVPFLAETGGASLGATGLAAAGGVAARLAKDWYTRRLLQNPYLTNRLVNAGLGRPAPATPISVGLVQQAERAPVPVVQSLYQNRGQQ